MKNKWIKSKKKEFEHNPITQKEIVSSHTQRDSRRPTYEEVLESEKKDRINAIRNRKLIKNFGNYRCPFCDSVMNVYECKGEKLEFIMKECSNNCPESLKNDLNKQKLDQYNMAKCIANWHINKLKTEGIQMLKNSYGYKRITAMNDKYFEAVKEYGSDSIEARELLEKAEELENIYSM